MNSAPDLENSGTITLDPTPTRMLPIDDERRSSRRIAAGVSALVRSLDGEDVPCTMVDLGPGGLHVHAPLDLGLAVGQRYQVVITDVPDEAAMPDLCGEEHYVTVLRTEPRTDERVGVGMRFDQPLFF